MKGKLIKTTFLSLSLSFLFLRRYSLVVRTRYFSVMIGCSCIRLSTRCWILSIENSEGSYVTLSHSQLGHIKSVVAVKGVHQFSSLLYSTIPHHLGDPIMVESISAILFDALPSKKHHSVCMKKDGFMLGMEDRGV